MNNSARWRLPSLALAACMGQAGAAPPAELSVYQGRARDSYHVTVADFEASQVLRGASATVPRPAAPKVPGSSVGVQVSAKDALDDALTLQWKDAWYASLRVEGGAPVDLRPYTTLAFDLKVSDLARGGLAFKLNCGPGCERQVPFLVPGRALAGKGWQELVLSMDCFAREGDDFSAVSQPFALDASGTGSVSIANVRYRQGGTPNAACPDYRTVSVTPDMLNESWSIDWWLPRHQAKLAEVKNSPSAEIVFIGDSITHNWEKEGAAVWQRHFAPYKAINLGYGGDRTENVLWRLQHGEVDGIRPRVVVLMVGTNNTGARQEDPRTTAAGIKKIIKELRQRLPVTKILLLGIFPRDEGPDGPLRRINEQVNARLPALADGTHIFYLNINKAFLDADGVLSKDIMPDLLHPNEKGYSIWAGAVAPTLRKLMQPLRSN